MVRQICCIQCRSLFTKRKEPGPPCNVFVNQDLPHNYFDQKGCIKNENVYATNQVVTSKYTLRSALP